MLYKEVLIGLGISISSILTDELVYIGDAFSSGLSVFFSLPAFVWLLFQGRSYFFGNDLHTCAHAVYTSRGYYLRVTFISLRASNCAATI